MKGFTIAIDGPVAAGKGTIAPLLAKTLNGFYLYTGAMYRCLALLGIEEKLNLDNEYELIKLLPSIDIELSEDKVLLSGRDVTTRLQEADVAAGSAKVAIFPAVRRVMVKKQQEIAEKFIGNGKIVIAEGRDAGTMVFPKADLKVFLTATPEVRAKRRLEQFKKIGSQLDYDKVLKDVKDRDRRDSTRIVDPLISNPVAHGYVIIDNTNLSEEQTVNLILNEVKNKGLL